MKLFKNTSKPLLPAAAMALVCLLASIACQREALPDGEQMNPSVDEDDCLYAVVENPSESRTVIGATGETGYSLVWSEDDQVAAFMQSPSAHTYQIDQESAGKTSAKFVKVSEDSVPSAEWNHNVVWYPYADNVSCVKSETEEIYTLSVTLPSGQTYAPGTFCSGAFPMVAVSEDRDLSFKNVCGGIKLQLKGTVKVSSIRIEGKNAEKLSGLAVVTACAGDAEPEIVMGSDASASVVLDCGDVQLNETSAVDFFVTLPPVTFTEGFTVTVTDSDGHKYTMDGAENSAVSRSSFLVMPEIVVDDCKTIRILAIGNSFSVDAMAYLYGILEDLGYRKIVLGDLYEAGCLVEEHASWFASNSAKYTYYHNVTGGYDASKSDSSEKHGWTRTSSFAPMGALTETDWDFITIQQGSKYSGMADTYEPYLGNLLEIVSSECPTAELVWHMTWAYQSDSDHSSFPNYGNDQMTMYNGIRNAVMTKVLARDEISRVIPNGTAVQNLRTSFFGDNLTRDGYHLSLREGRYLAALAYAKTLTGCDLASVSYTPEEYEYTDVEIAAIKDAVDKACTKPYEVTVSDYSLSAHPELTPFTNESFETVSSGFTAEDWK